MARPTHRQIKAVHGVLYAPARLKQIAEDFQQLNMAINLDGPALQPDDVRGQVGAGPEWVIPATGAVDTLVLDAAARCDRIVARLMTMRHEISLLDLPAADRQHLMAALAAQARTWSARASLWRSPTAPDDIQAAVAPITNHQQAAFTALGHVRAYLRPASDFSTS